MTPLLHKLDNAVGQQFCMDAQVLFVLQVGQNRVGNASITDLDGVAVLNDACHILPDLLGNLVITLRSGTPGAARHRDR